MQKSRKEMIALPGQEQIVSLAVEQARGRPQASRRSHAAAKKPHHCHE
jgi:hypothetical protein